ncbi:hypothetical protein [Nonomuraea typhae]|uniref:Uncharacterized protein n=1 Tax=Nonomuraea typhae TaxID=2603600 RepID=A0ABW7YZ49_9ACTN
MSSASSCAPCVDSPRPTTFAPPTMRVSGSRSSRGAAGSIVTSGTAVLLTQSGTGVRTSVAARTACVIMVVSFGG